MQSGTKVWLTAAIAIIAATAGMQLARLQQSPPPDLNGGTWLPAPRATPHFALTDQRGQPADETRLRGQPTLLFFGFSNCPEVCPTTLALLAELRRKSLLQPLQVVMVSIDPGRDSPEQLRRYLGAFDPSFIGLTGDPAVIGMLTKAFSAVAARQDLPGGDYTMDHSSTVYLLDRAGQLVAVFTQPLSIDSMRHDLDALRERLG